MVNKMTFNKSLVLIAIMLMSAFVSAEPIKVEIVEREDGGFMTKPLLSDVPMPPSIESVAFRLFGACPFCSVAPDCPRA